MDILLKQKFNLPEKPSFPSSIPAILADDYLCVSLNIHIIKYFSVFDLSAALLPEVQNLSVIDTLYHIL